MTVLVLVLKVTFGMKPLAGWFEKRLRLAVDVLLSPESEVGSLLFLRGMDPSVLWMDNLNNL